MTNDFEKEFCKEELFFIVIEPNGTVTKIDVTEEIKTDNEELLELDSWNEQIMKINSGEIQSRSAREFLKEMRENDEWNDV